MIIRTEKRAAPTISTASVLTTSHPTIPTDKEITTSSPDDKREETTTSHPDDEQPSCSRKRKRSDAQLDEPSESTAISSKQATTSQISPTKQTDLQSIEQPGTSPAKLQTPAKPATPAPSPIKSATPAKLALLQRDSQGCFSSQGSTSTLDLSEFPETKSRLAMIFADSEADSDSEIGR
eukprot:sb/3471771/